MIPCRYQIFVVHIQLIFASDKQTTTTKKTENQTSVKRNEELVLIYANQKRKKSDMEHKFQASF